MTNRGAGAGARTHIVRNPGDKRAICGLKNPLPVVAAAYVLAHVNRRGVSICGKCWRGRLELVAGAGRP